MARVPASNGGMVNGVSKMPFLIGVAGGTASGKVRIDLNNNQTTLKCVSECMYVNVFVCKCVCVCSDD